MTDENIGFDAWRGKVVGGGDPNPFHPKESTVEAPKSEGIEVKPEDKKPEMEASARIMVADGNIPGAIFDANFLNEAIEKGHKIFHSKSGLKDHIGNPILEIVISDGHTEKVVGYTTTDNPDEYVHLREAEIKQ